MGVEAKQKNDSDGKVLRSGRVSKPPKWWRAYATSEQHNARTSSASKEISNSYKEPTTGTDASFWQKSIDSKIASQKSIRRGRWFRGQLLKIGKCSQPDGFSSKNNK